MRMLLVSILVAVVCAGCGPLSELIDGSSGTVCSRGANPGGQPKDNVDPLQAGEPLAGLDVTSMSAAQVGSLASDKGLAVTWRYSYDTGEPSSSSGYSECWCVAPSDGHVAQVLYDSTGALIVFVDSGKRLPFARSQPRLGWGCGEERAAAKG
jgi:uncharacterized protein YceK